MKIRFIQPWTVKQGDGKGAKYGTGDIVEFKGGIAETYARKYIARGLAVEYSEAEAREAARKRREDADRVRREQEAAAEAERLRIEQEAEEARRLAGIGSGGIV